MVALCRSLWTKERRLNYECVYIGKWKLRLSNCQQVHATESEVEIV